MGLILKPKGAGYFLLQSGVLLEMCGVFPFPWLLNIISKILVHSSTVSELVDNSKDTMNFSREKACARIIYRRLWCVDKSLYDGSVAASRRTCDCCRGPHLPPKNIFSIPFKKTSPKIPQNPSQHISFDLPLLLPNLHYLTSLDHWDENSFENK